MAAPSESTQTQQIGISRPAQQAAHGRPTETSVSIDLAHIAGLSALAVAQPTLGLIAANTQFLATHDARGWRLAVLVASLVLGPPFLASVLELAAGRVAPRARSAVHSVLIAILVAVLARQGLDRLWPGADAWIVLGLALAAGVAFAIVYRKLEPMRAFVTFLAASTIVVPATFLFDARVDEFISTAQAVELYPVEVPHPVPIVIVIFDELPLASLLDREGQTIDADLFPNFARLAATSNWYRRATTTGTSTFLAVPSIHNGRYSPTDRAISADLGHYPENLFTLFGSTYDLHALETTVHLLPEDLTRVITSSGDTGRRPPLLLDTAAIALQVTTPRPWSARLPRIGDAWSGFWTLSGGDDRTGAPPSKVQELRDFIATLAPSSRPPFVYIHPWFPHFPWNTLPSGRGYFDLDRMLPGHGEVWAQDEWLVLQGYQRHRIQVAAADTVLGELLDQLAALGWWDEALIVVTADHGAAFTPGASRRELRPEQEEILLGQVMPVPLLIKLPGQRTPIVDDRAAELVDLLPTIADALDIELPWSVDGRSLLEPARATPHRRRLQILEPYTTLDLDDREGFPAGAIARSRNAAFGKAPDGSTDLFRIGPAPELLGQSVEAASSSPHRALLADETLYRGVGPDDPNLPALVRGTIEPATGTRLPPGASIAVAINGVVRATTRATVMGEGETSFRAMVPEGAIARGDNHVEIFLVGNDASLARLDAKGSQETLREASSAAPILFSADALTGWDGFKGVLGARLESGPDGDLMIESPGGRLRADLPPFDAKSADSIVVAIDLETDADLTPFLFYQIENEPAFRFDRRVRGSARRGRSTTYLRVEGPDLRGALSIDFGRSATIQVHSIEVRLSR